MLEIFGVPSASLPPVPLALAGVATVNGLDVRIGLVERPVELLEELVERPVEPLEELLGPLRDPFFLSPSFTIFYLTAFKEQSRFFTLTLK